MPKDPSVVQVSKAKRVTIWREVMVTTPQSVKNPTTLDMS
jgi:hypothetical protein